MWLPALGFHPSMVIVCLGIEALWQFQLHTKFMPKLGFIEKFMNTYTMHQAHHAQNMQYLDKNHGGYLNMFDKIFGTHADLDDNIDVKYGVIHAPNSYNPFVIATHEYADIWRDIKKSKNLKEAFSASSTCTSKGAIRSVLRRTSRIVRSFIFRRCIGTTRQNLSW